MYESLKELILSLVAPLLAAQIFLMVLVYFTVVRKRISAFYKGYVLFLACFILFLVGRPFQHGAVAFSQPVLYFRIFLLYALAIPSLLIAAAAQSGVEKRRILSWGAYGAGLLVTFLYILYRDTWFDQFAPTREMRSWATYSGKIPFSHIIQAVGVGIMLALPSLYLMVRELRGARNVKQLAFLSGAFLFGGIMFFASLTLDYMGYFYVGSVFCALCWSWAVFQDVRDMKGRVSLLKDELQMRVQSGGRDVDDVLDGLEQLSLGNLDVYKLRLREVLNRLTDVTIEAGGDTEVLIRRNSQRGSDIDAGSDVAVLREIVKTEAAELSVMIAGMPAQRKNEYVDGAKAFMREHFERDFAVDEIAESLGISKAYLMREFKKGTGQTVNQFLTALRIEKAKELLADSNVTDTAFSVGYNDSGYFGTVFKKHTGQTPLQFKNNL
ncbi:HTH-type transcriptional activator Btr [Pontiella desulfatans]|uniref:HTH-type transcriptional activator Btr n=1 Tax=Pontiella desulfatans TaxID=2750659 RepID=A0A6C2U4M6_PONDE|nr:AraC family transcriptional regulator [Pontiella desulfatans]VGO14930.1 HTH-type transcriptional activator Btr [Pontiella desulfatans]